MKVYKEVNCHDDFDFWSGAKDTCNTLTEGEITEVITNLEDCYPEGMTATELNDFFWFETDTIAEWLGWPDYETLYKARTGGNWYYLYEDYEEAKAEEEYEARLNEAIHNFRVLIDRTFSEWYFGQTDDSYLREKIKSLPDNPSRDDETVYDVLDEIVYDVYHWDTEDERHPIKFEDGVDVGFEEWTNTDEADAIYDAINDIDNIVYHWV